MPFENKKILVGITGSIAAYKAPLLVRELIKEGAAVNTIMTPSAKHFTAPLVLENLSRNPVVIDMFGDIQEGGAWHIQLAHWCDAFIIAPCSASTLGKITHGICDNALTTVALALPKSVPLIISPAMDSTMWLSAAVQRNVKFLKNDGAIIIPPAEGELSSGLKGPGRLPDLPILLKYIDKALNWKRGGNSDSDTSEKNKSSSENDNKGENIEVVIERKPGPKDDYNKLQEALGKSYPNLQDAVEKDKWSAELELDKLKRKMQGSPAELELLKGKRVLITAGPTREKIDAVRYISNFSSGKMGYALAAAAKEMGADVSLISGPAAIKAPEGAVFTPVDTAREMYDAVIKDFVNADIAILAAAVADYAPAEPSEGKLKKENMGEESSLKLERTKDILKRLGEIKRDGQFLAGFALETDGEIENGWKKLQDKKADMIVVNSANKPQSGFDGDENTITILTTDGKQASYPPMPKTLCAYNILRKIAEAIEGKKL